MVDRQDEEEKENREEKKALRSSRLEVTPLAAGSDDVRLNHAEVASGGAAKDRWPMTNGRTYHDTVIPGEDGQFVQTGNEVPPSGDIARDEDPKGEDGKGVHESRRFRQSVFGLRA
ncbi:hypothetical protein N7535_000883 [Penicillium sp. DV-2018c]|nr:hypothetical protein N7535_000883 [Penicillium sp. DV-2018c]